MFQSNIILPSKMTAVYEEGNKGIYEIDGLHPGYGYTLGNSLRRIILSSLGGAAITSVKIKGVDHEFSTIEGVKEDVISIILHLRMIRFRLNTNEPQFLSLNFKGPQIIKAGDIKTSGQVEILNKDLYIAEITGKETLSIEMTIERGLGFRAKDDYQKTKNEIGTISLDAIFTPIRRVSYEVENMRVGDSTNYNRLRMTIETDGSFTPREALEKSIVIMIEQLHSILGHTVDLGNHKKEEIIIERREDAIMSKEQKLKNEQNEYTDFLKTRIDTLNFSTRTQNALSQAGIRTIGGIARKKQEDLLEISGNGEKGIQEIKKMLGEYGITLK